MTIKVHVTIIPAALEEPTIIDYVALDRLFWLCLAEQCDTPPSLITDGELLFHAALRTPDEGWPYIDTGRKPDWKAQS